MPPVALPLRRTDFLGVDFDLLDFDSAVAWLKARHAEDNFGYVVTPNVDHLVRLERERAALAPLYEGAALRLCDSRVLGRLAKLVGIQLPVVPGSDLVLALFNSGLAPGDTLLIIGGRAAAIASLRERYPAVDVRHVEAPMGLRTNAAARATVAADAALHRARFTLIAIGSPQQEMLAVDLRHRADARGTALCIGASIDFIVGDQRRAPRLVQRAGMEWAWRLAGNPRRFWRRYVIEGPRIFLIYWAWLQARRRRGFGAA